MDAIQIFTVVLGVAGSLGVVFGYFQKSRAETIIELQAREIETLSSSNQRIKEENIGLLKENELLRQQVDYAKPFQQNLQELDKLTREFKKLLK